MTVIQRSDESSGGGTITLPDTPFDDRYLITFVSNGGSVVAALAGEGSAVLTGGFGGWEVVDRPHRTGMTRYKGRAPYAMDVPILFDGFVDGISQEASIANLIDLAVSEDEEASPLIKVSGAVPKPEVTWIINDFTWDSQSTQWDFIDESAVRVRQAVVVHLLEYVDDEVINTPTAPGIVGKRIDDAGGKTLKQLSQIHYGTPDLWSLFLSANPGLNPDPRAIIPKGTHIIVPPVPKTKVPRVRWHPF